MASELDIFKIDPAVKGQAKDPLVLEDTGIDMGVIEGASLFLDREINKPIEAGVKEVAKEVDSIFNAKGLLDEI